MLFGRTPRRILACLTAVDMRRSFSGLSASATRVFGSEELLSGTVFLFVNKTQTIAKLLFWDRTGFVVVAKRLESGRFSAAKEELSLRELELLFDGICRRKL